MCKANLEDITSDKCGDFCNLMAALEKGARAEDGCH